MTHPTTAGLENQEPNVNEPNKEEENRAKETLSRGTFSLQENCLFKLFYERAALIDPDEYPVHDVYFFITDDDETEKDAQEVSAGVPAPLDSMIVCMKTMRTITETYMEQAEADVDTIMANLELAQGRVSTIRALLDEQNKIMKMIMEALRA